MDKIKEFIAKNKKAVIIGGSAVALLVVVGIVLALVLGGGNAGLSGCTVEVKTEGGMALEGVGVYIYENADKKEMVSFAKTNETGAVAFAEAIPTGSIVVLEDVPAGYTVAENYPVTGTEMQITLSAELLKEMTDIKLGGIMFDFTVTDTDGTEHTLSQLLKEKKAVVLNLWYTSCQPCKMEFPYLEQAYNAYSGDIALLALNPVADDDDAAVAAFKKDNQLTFPMAKCDAKWAELISGLAYPTTVVIDRYGMVALIHTGSIDNTKTFKDAFAFFTAEDYVQTAVESIQDLFDENAPTGTKENPVELGGETAFEVTVDAGQTVYYNLYRVSGMELSAQSPTLKILCGETEHTPVDNVITFTLDTTAPMVPTLLGFTNTGSATETYKVTLTQPKGTRDNPLDLTLGDFTANVAQGNDQGVFYTYTAAEKGNLTITVKQAPKDVQYDIALNNLNTSKYMTLGENATKDADGNTTLVLPVSKDDAVQLIVTVLPNSENVYPAASVSLNAAIVKEETQGGSSGGSTGGSSGGNYNGTLVNADDPIIQFGMSAFEVEVGVGEKKLVNMARVVIDGTLSISDADAYVVYKGKTYKPNKSGKIYISIAAQDGNTILPLEIGNAGTSAKTFQVKFSFPKGSRENPIKLEQGETTVNVKAGNDQGVFYTYKASAAGTLTLTVKSVDPASAICGIMISDMQSVPTVVTMEDGANTVSIELPANAKAEIIISTKDANDEWKIPKADIVIETTFG